LLVLIAFWTLTPCLRAADLTPRDQTYQQSIRPFLQKHCFECHDDSMQKGDVRLDDLPASFDKLAAHALWTEAFDKIASGEMPPKKKARPDQAESARVLAFLSTELTAADLARRTASGRVVLRRLNRAQYENSIHDLLGVHVPIKDLLPEDGASMGFDNVAAALNVSSVLMERYLEAADAALDLAIHTGPELKPRGWQQAMGPGMGNPNDYRLKQGVKYLPDQTFVYFSTGETANMLDRWQVIE